MMLMRFLGWWCWGTFLVVATPAWAVTDAATAESLMRKSGLWEQLAGIAPQVRTGMLASIAQSGRKLSSTEIERLTRAVDTAYSVQRLRSGCLSAISKDLDQQRVAALRRWFDAPTGRTITRLEEALSRHGDERAALEKGVALLGKMPVSRRRILDETVLATRSAELMADLTISTMLATQQGVASVSPEAAYPTAGEVKARLDAQRQQLIRTFSRIAVANFAVAYSSLSTEELGAYVDFLKSEAGRHFTAVGSRAFSAVMLDAAAQLGRAIPGSRDKANT